MLAGGVLGCQHLDGAYTTMSIGAQLYTVRVALERDLHGTLAAVARLGYKNVELASLAGHSPQAFRTALDQTGLKAPSFHADWRDIKDNPAAAITKALAVGASTLVLAWMPPETRVTLDQWRLWTDVANRACELTNSAGLAFGWHNHDFEFRPIDNVVPFDVLVERFSTQVKFEIDVYWAQRAGVSPLELMTRLAGRVTMLHIKDMARDSDIMADPGLGRIDLRAILDLAPKIGVQHLFVERDDSPEPMSTLRQGYHFLSTQLQRN
jgi:sugar phosphate isomerase/epimerase